MCPEYTIRHRKITIFARISIWNIINIFLINFLMEYCKYIFNRFSEVFFNQTYFSKIRFWIPCGCWVCRIVCLFYYILFSIFITYFNVFVFIIITYIIIIILMYFNISYIMCFLKSYMLTI